MKHTPCTVAFLGPHGTYSHRATLNYFGNTPFQPLPVATISAVFENLLQKTATFGVVPLRNSTAGFIDTTVTGLAHPLIVQHDKLSLPIQHCLLALDKDTPIHKIYAHPQSFAQCEKWLQQHMPHAIKQIMNSNAEGVQHATKDATSAAIAGAWCADEYGLIILHPQIADQPDNTTDFVIIKHL